MADQETDLRQAVRQALAEMLAEHRLPPLPYPVTEVTVRVGPPEALLTLSSRGAAGQYPLECFPIGGIEALRFGEAEEELIQRVLEASAGMTREQLLLRLLERVLPQELRRYAREAGIQEAAAAGEPPAAGEQPQAGPQAG